MRHRLKTNNLNRTTEHRKALYRNMAINLFTWSPDKIEDKAKQGVKDRGQPYRHFNSPYQIKTTLPKAKASRSFVDRCVTLAKKAVVAEAPEAAKDKNVHFRRKLITLLGGNATAKRIAKHLINEIAPNYKERSGGYTRIVKLPKLGRMIRLENHLSEGKKRSRYLGTRLGDNSEICLFELVEFDGQEYQPAMAKLLPDSMTVTEEEDSEE